MDNWSRESVQLPPPLPLQTLRFFKLEKIGMAFHSPIRNKNVSRRLVIQMKETTFFLGNGKGGG